MGMGKLKQIHRNLPLRTVPLEIKSFTPMQARYDESAVNIQNQAISAWNHEVEKRFSQTERLPRCPAFVRSRSE